MHSPYGGDILRTYDAMLDLKAQGLTRFVQTFIIILKSSFAVVTAYT